MPETNPQKFRELAVRIASHASHEEKDALRAWIEQVQEIRASSLPAAQKARQAIAVTANRKLVLPAVKRVSREIKAHMWDNRNPAGKLGLSGLTLGAIAFGGKGAGIAALGTAVGVPLWLLTAAGGTFLGVLYEELTGRRGSQP